VRVRKVMSNDDYEVMEEYSIIPNAKVTVERLGDKKYIRVKVNYTITSKLDLPVVEGYLKGLASLIKLLAIKHLKW